MILVDVYVPSIDSTFDFQLDENTPIIVLIDKITEILSEKIRIVMKDDSKKFMLCSYDHKRILDTNQTLLTSGITNGSRLLLV